MSSCLLQIVLFVQNGCSGPRNNGEDIVLLGIGKAELNLVADMLGLSDNCDSASVTDRDGGAVIFVTLTD